MEYEFTYGYGDVTDLQPDLPYFFTNMPRMWGATRILGRAPVSEERQEGWRISVLIVGKRAAQLGGINPTVTISIK